MNGRIDRLVKQSPVQDDLPHVRRATGPSALIRRFKRYRHVAVGIQPGRYVRQNVADAQRIPGEVRWYANMYHELLNDPEAERVIEDVTQFLARNDL